MRALEIQSLTGPDGVAVVDAPEPTDDGRQVIVDVVCAGVSFPDLLQSKGMYQLRPDPPFRPGFEAAGVVRSAPAGAGVVPGDRVAVWSRGCLADVAAAAPENVFRLPDEFSLKRAQPLF
jgi:NADPH:quinone reductase